MDTSSPAFPTLSDLFPQLTNTFLAGARPSPVVAAVGGGIGLEEFQAELRLLSLGDSAEGGARVLTALWRHEGTGVEAEVVYRVWADTGTLEIEGRLFHRGTEPVEHFAGGFPLMFVCDLPSDCLPRVTTLTGGANVSGCYPPPAYRVLQADLPVFGDWSLLGGRWDGRSTESVMPYLLVTDPERGDGCFAVLEWPCSWVMSASVGGDESGARHLQLYAHPAWIDSDLQPGESVVLPRALLGFFSGDDQDGSNALRRHVVRHVLRAVAGGGPDACARALADSGPCSHSAPPGGAPPLPPVFYNHWYQMGNDWTLPALVAEAEAYADLGAEYFVMDAGWFAGGFRGGLGTGSRQIRRGSRGGWRSWRGASRRWECALGRGWRSSTPWPSRTGGSGTATGSGTRPGTRTRCTAAGGSGSCCCGWTTRRCGGRWRSSWRRGSSGIRSAGCAGISTTRRIPSGRPTRPRGAPGGCTWATAKGCSPSSTTSSPAAPQVHLEACAGGGHRMDLGTLRRAHSAWMSDNSHSYDAIRRFQMGLNRVLPGNFGGSCFLWGTHEHQRSQPVAALQARGYPPAVLRSRMAGSLGFSEASALWTAEMREYLRQEIARYKAIRHLLQKDFYPLYQPQSLREYDGWQFHDPETGEGTVMVFRCRAEEERTEIRLRGLGEGRYEMTDVDTGERWEQAGGEARELRVAEKEGTRWLRYRRG